jgi:glutaminase
VILDFKRVLTANESSCRLFYQLLTKCSQLAKTVQYTQIQGIPLLRRYMKAKLAGRFETLFRDADDTDLALEWCENQLLQASGRLVQDAEAATPDQYEFCEHFTGDELKAFSSLLHHRSYRPNETIMDAGDAANEMFFLARGRVSVFIAFEEGAQKRLATFSPGMVFGEMAFIDGSPRSAGIKADTEVECDVLTRENFDKLSGIHPGLKIKLLDGILLSLCHRLRKANRELSLLQ